MLATYFQTNNTKIENCRFVICEVYFQEGPMLSILHCSWLVSSDNITQYCLWPNKKGSSVKLAKSESYPEDSWIQYKCRIIYKCESFTQAQKKINRFANDNNYKGETTNDEDKGREKRQKFRYCNLITDDELNSQEFPSFIKSLPKAPSWAKHLNDSDNDMFEPAYHSTYKSKKTNHKDDSDNDIIEPAYHSTDISKKTNHNGYTNNSDKDNIMVELNSSAREISQDGRSQGEMTFNDACKLIFMEIYQLLQTSCKNNSKRHYTLIVYLNNY